MNKNNDKWKKRFLSSSLPLEFEVARLLTCKKFMVTYDYSFLRKAEVELKEFSVDIKGFLHFPINNNNEIEASLSVLIECKYRDVGKKWLFLPDTNVEISHQVLGNGIRNLGLFSKRNINASLIYNFERKIDFGLKGVELNISSGEVVEKDIKHGINQLKYALPYLIKDSIEHNIWGHFNDIVPDFIIPILVTTADLYTLKKDFKINDLKNIDSIEDIANKVPYLFAYSDIGPDFTEHHKQVFDNFYIEASITNNNLKELEKIQSKFLDPKFNFYNSPTKCCNELEQSDRTTLTRYYTHFLICSFDNLEIFIKEILKMIPKTIKN